MAGTGVRVERFRAWLEDLGSALERGDLDSAAGLFVMEATWRSGPFEPALHGRQAIRKHLARLVADRPGLVIRGRALGMGATYGVAHWVAAWAAPAAASPADAQSAAPAVGAGTAPGAFDVPMTSDGILLVAFDPTGRCTSLREWSLTGGGSAEAGVGHETPPSPSSEERRPR